MLIPRVDRPGLRAFERALRAGEPVRLGRGAFGARPAVPPDELVPLCHGVDDPDLEPWLPPGARPGSGHAVSVVIPTHRQIPLGLPALEAQDLEVEVLVLANGGMRAGAHGQRPSSVVAWHPLPWQGHGATRNVGVQLARHPYVLLLSDDAIPLGAGFVRTLVNALVSSGADAVTARQVPWPTADPVTRARLRAWTPPPDASGQPSAPPQATLDDVAALYRREALLADPFDAVAIAEDWRWARRHRVAYAPDAAVLHSHTRTFRDVHGRTRALHLERTLAGEPPTIGNLGALVRALPGVVGRDAPGALGELLGQYLGARDARR